MNIQPQTELKTGQRRKMWLGKLLHGPLSAAGRSPASDAAVTNKLLFSKKQYLAHQPPTALPEAAGRNTGKTVQAGMKPWVGRGKKRTLKTEHYQNKDHNKQLVVIQKQETRLHSNFQIYLQY